MFSVQSQPGENLGKVCETDSWPIRLGFSLTCPQILPNIRLGFH